MRTSLSPAATASSTTYWIAGLSTTGSISFGVALVAGRKRVPRPAAGITALVTAGPSPSPDAVKGVRSVMGPGYPAWLTVAAPGDIPAPAMRHASRPARLAA